MADTLVQSTEQNVQGLLKNINPEQHNQDWSIAIMRHYYSNYGAYYLSKFVVDEIRTYAYGRQSPTKYRTWFDVKSKKADYVNFLSFDQIISPIPKLREIVIERMMKVFTKFTATAIDPASMNKKNQDMLKLKFQNILDEDLKEISAKLQMKRPMKSGFDKEILGRDTKNGYQDIATTYDLDLSKDDERQLYIDIYYKQAVEIAMENALQLFIEYNATDEIIRKLCEDAVDLGLMSYRVFMDETTKLPTIRPLPIETVGVPPSSRNDFREAKLMWVEEWMTINEVVQMAGDGLSNEHIEKMFSDACTQLGGWRDVYGNLLYWDKMTRTQREDYKIRMVYYEIKAVNSLNYEKKKDTTNGTYDLFKRDSTWQVPAKYKATSSQQSYYAEVIYKGYWQPMTENAFAFGLLYNMNRDDINKQRTDFSIYVQRVAKKSMVESLMPLEDDFMLLNLKLQHAIIMSKPKGYQMNLLALQNAVSLGVEGFKDASEIIKLFQQTGNILMSPVDIEGNMSIGNTQGMTEMQNGLGAEVSGYMEAMAERLNIMKEICGINDAVDASSPNPKDLVGTQKLAVNASYTTTEYLNRGLIAILERGGKYLSKLIQDIVIYKTQNPTAYEFLTNALGRYNAAVLESMDEMSASQFGIQLEVVPTDTEQQFALEAMQNAVKSGELKTSDLLIIAPMIVKNYKLASRIISIRAKRNEALAMQNNQAQIQAQQQMELQVSQMKIMAAKIMADAQTSKADIEGKWQYVIAELKTAVQKSMHDVKAQMQQEMQTKEFQQNMTMKGIEHAQEQDAQRTQIEADQQQQNAQQPMTI